MVTGLLAYIMNYIIGKNKNSRLAQAWFSSHRELLESNFALVGESFGQQERQTRASHTRSLTDEVFASTGDDGTSKDAVSTGKLNQENEHIYNLWCSGRVCCEGMLIQLKVRPLRGRRRVRSNVSTRTDSGRLFQFLKRQDLLNVLARMMRPICDQVVRKLE